VKGPEITRTGKGQPGDRGADIDIHLHDAGRHGDGVGASQNLPWRYVSQRQDVGEISLFDSELNIPVEYRGADLAFVMIGVVAHIETRLGRHDAAEDIGIALHPRAGTILCGMRGAGANARGERHAESNAKYALTQTATAPQHGFPHFAQSLMRGAGL
jgi:hypothetical protein